MAPKQDRHLTTFSRQLRASQTKAESLLWTALRGRRLCGLKFRRQYPVGQFIADFACIERRLIIEVDGGYHDNVYENDRRRQEELEAAGWSVLRFQNEDVIEDVEAVAVAIARTLGLNPDFRRT